MKKIFYCFVLTGMLMACSEKKNTNESKDSAKVSQINSATTETLYLEDILQCGDLKCLEEKFGAKNVKKDTIMQVLDGENKITLLFPGTDKEVQIFWKDGQEYKDVQEAFVKAKITDEGGAIFNSPWVSKEGLKLGMKLADVVSLNGKNITITGLGWDLGGNVVSWEGGKLANKNITIRFNDFSNNMGGLTEAEYNSISGDREFDTHHTAITKLNPTVDELSVYKKPEIDAELGKKMTKEVEKKQIPR